MQNTIQELISIAESLGGMDIEQWEEENEQSIYDSLEIHLEGTGRSLNNTDPNDIDAYPDIVEELYEDYVRDLQRDKQTSYLMISSNG